LSALGQNPVLSHETVSAAKVAGTDATFDIEAVALDQQRKFGFDQFDRIVVGIAVGKRDQRVGSIAVVTGAPSAVSWLDMDKQLARCIVSRDIGDTQAGIGACRKPFGQNWSQCLPDELGSLHGSLIVPAGGRGALGGKQRAL